MNIPSSAPPPAPGSWLPRILAAALSLAALPATGAPPPAATPASVVLVTIDTLRWDHVGAYGASGTTPALDALAASGTRIARTYATAPVTLPSHASILTGRYPFHHGVRTNGLFRLEASASTLAEHLASRGYATAAFVSAYVLERRFGVDQGFAHYDDEMTRGESGGGAVERPAGATVDRAIARLPELRPPFFLWVHLYDPHVGYDPPEPWRSRFAQRLYDGEVAYADAELGRLRDAVQAVVPDALWCVTADHGESLGEHGESTHSVFVYDATIRVPWILAGRGVPKGRVLEVPASHVDVAPTLLELLGVPLPAELDGRSLAAAVRGGAEGAGRPLYSESFAARYDFGWSELRALRDGPLELVAAPEVELYDTASDPRERKNLAPVRGPDVARLQAELARIAGPDMTAEPGGSRAELDAASVEALRSLGYLQAGGSGAATKAGARPDPKHMIALTPLLDEAATHLEAGRFAQARDALAKVRRKDPGSPLVAQLLGMALAGLGDQEGALAALAEGTTRADARTEAGLRRSRGELLRKMDRLPEAEKELARARELDPASAEAAKLLGEVSLAAERRDEARSRFEAALVLRPGYPEPLLYLGEMALDRKDPADARKRFEALLADARFRPRGLLGLARLAAVQDDRVAARSRAAEVVAERSADPATLQRAGTLAAGLGDAEGLELAVNAFRAALRIAGGDATLHRDLGVALSRSGRHDEAVAEIRRSLQISDADAATWNALGTACARAGRMADAKAAWEEALSRDPGNAAAAKNLEQLRSRGAPMP